MFININKSFGEVQIEDTVLVDVLIKIINS